MTRLKKLSAALSAALLPDATPRPVHGFSPLQVWPLKESSKLSGRGDNRSYVCWVYYEQQDEQSVLRAFNNVEVKLKDSEREAVDPETSIKNEETLLRAKDCRWTLRSGGSNVTQSSNHRLTSKI
eukprot:g6421.t1